MSNQKYISVKVCGNPHASSGFMPLVLFNSPDFAIEDRAISGFRANSYFFSLKIEKAQVIYNLYKNNVRSFSSFRQGTLVIAFSLPKGYGFEKGVGPYRVMMALKDKFLSSCMTCRDSVNETYEFNDGQIDQKVLDEVARQYPLIPHEGPYCEMHPTAPVGYLKLSEKQIEQFLNDVQYRELQKYSEVFIAENLENPQSSSLVPDLQIPRRPQYKISVDGKPVQFETDIDKPLAFSSQANGHFYKNGSVSFTIRELLANNNPDPDHVKFYSAFEEIQVTTAGLEKPIEKTFQLVLEPHQEFFKQQYQRNKKSLQLRYKYGLIQHPITLNSDLSFKLKGKDIGFTENSAAFELKYYGEGQSAYQFVSYKFDVDRLVVTVQKSEYRQEPPVYGKGQGGNRGNFNEKQSSTPRQLVLQIKDKNDDISGSPAWLRVKVVSGGDSNSSRVVFSKPVKFESTKRDKKVYVGTLNMPDDIQGAIDVFYFADDTCYKASNPIYLGPNDNEMQLSAFQEYKESFAAQKISLQKGLMWLLCSALLCLVLGGLGGYFLRGCTGQHNSGRTHNEIVDENSAGGEKKFLGGDSGESQTEELTEQQAQNNMKFWLETLKKDSVTFNEIEDINNQYEAQKSTYSEFCGDNECKMIEDYNRLKTLIVNGQFDQIKKTSWNNWNIYQKHKNIVSNVIDTKNQQIKQQVISNYKNYHSFIEIKNDRPKAQTSSEDQNKGKKKKETKKREER
ncbi:MAG: hypothetical protein IKW85_04785 [Muribaculaceae bacterium]|nr:hypothetical protein [Muribaculaceae bacterium]